MFVFYNIGNDMISSYFKVYIIFIRWIFVGFLMCVFFYENIMGDLRKFS